MNHFKTQIRNSEKQSPAYYRARLLMFTHLVKNSDEKSIVLLRNGVLPANYTENEIDVLIDSFYDKNNNSPLNFTELTSYNTWFAMHLEKVAGKEFITTSIQFPLTIKGTKEDVINTINKGLETKGNDIELRIRIANANAKAKLKLLNL